MPQSLPQQQPQSAAPKGPVRRYRVLAGKHVEGKTVDQDGNKAQIVYRRGEIVETHKDLLRLNHPNAPKFELVEDDGRPQRDPVAQAITPLTSQPQATTPTQPAAPATPAPTAATRRGTETLDGMNVKELRQFAESEEISLKGVPDNKEAIIKAIRTTLNAPV